MIDSLVSPNPIVARAPQTLGKTDISAWGSDRHLFALVEFIFFDTCPRAFASHHSSSEDYAYRTTAQGRLRQQISTAGCRGEKTSSAVIFGRRARSRIGDTAAQMMHWSLTSPCSA
nr:hypothetical protein CFP56_41262 [Quercus suber]